MRLAILANCFLFSFVDLPSSSWFGLIPSQFICHSSSVTVISQSDHLSVILANCFLFSFVDLPSSSWFGLIPSQFIGHSHQFISSQQRLLVFL
ncbi:hypothetical protein OUZ56_017046 [Daphnia magna]|uniref:Secreted protein n=1 Tax=Daphnia magna TaxID=35525 RepID=A0ABR0AS28_9CRUS|nr:hypothetical protein OUZ56_017046 [Daphnia magna]